MAVEKQIADKGFWVRLLAVLRIPKYKCLASKGMDVWDFHDIEDSVEDEHGYDPTHWQDYTCSRCVKTFWI